MSDDTTCRKRTSSAGATRVPDTAEHDRTELREHPTWPDTSLPWSQDYALGGWSARMFLHQLSRISTPRLMLSDTERRLSAWTPQRLRGKVGNGISFVDVFNDPGCSSAKCLRTPRMVRGLIRRALARGRSLRVLLHTGRDMIPVIVTFGNKTSTSYESWIITSAESLPVFLRDGLLAFLKRHAPECTATP